jgi:hypothetical protein
MRRLGVVIAVGIVGACGGAATRDESPPATSSASDAAAPSDASSSSDARADVDAGELVDARDAGDAASACPPITDPCDCRAGLSSCADPAVDCAPLASCAGSPFRYAPGACFKDYRLSGVDGCTPSGDGAALCCSFFN